MPEFPIIEVRGTPYVCGQQYGKQAAKRIQQAVDVYMPIFEYYTGNTSEAILAEASRYMPAIEAFDANIAAELRGVADGAELPLEAILAINARTELMSSAPMRGECSAFGVMEPATANQEDVYLVQNWDWLMPTANLPVILRIEQPKKPTILALAEAGQLGKIGMNSAGFGVCLNWLSSESRRMGVPVHIVTRKLLECTSAYAVVDVLYNHVRGAAANYLIANSEGFLINFETTPDEVDYFEPTDGTLAHTNHFESHRFRPIDRGVKFSGDSFPRLQRVKRLLNRHHGRIDKNLLQSILCDQQFAPFGICTTPAPEDPEMDRWSTLASVIYDLPAGKLLITPGNPSDESYMELSVN
jgi:isopenicillin-N N-acyltransferase like protein